MKAIISIYGECRRQWLQRKLQQRRKSVVSINSTSQFLSETSKALVFQANTVVVDTQAERNGEQGNNSPSHRQPLKEEEIKMEPIRYHQLNYKEGPPPEYGWLQKDDLLLPELHNKGNDEEEEKVLKEQPQQYDLSRQRSLPEVNSLRTDRINQFYQRNTLERMTTLQTTRANNRQRRLLNLEENETMKNLHEFKH